MAEKISDLTSRFEAARFAIANTEIEGGCVSQTTLDLMGLWISGGIDDDELIERGLQMFGGRFDR